jgi:hypothetical protein
MFCGWEPKKPTKDDPNGYLALLEDNEIHRVSDNILEELPYATDWNYLMTAYDKYRTEAEHLDSVHAMGEDDDIIPLMKIRDTLIEAILDFNINLAFKELVRGIETINQLKTEET